MADGFPRTGKKKPLGTVRAKRFAAKDAPRDAPMGTVRAGQKMSAARGPEHMSDIPKGDPKRKFDFFDPLTKPLEVFATERLRPDFKKAVFNYALIPAIMGFFLGLVLAIVSTFLLALAPGFSWVAALGPLLIIIVPAVVVAAHLLIELIVNGIVYLFARWLGGKGTFLQQFYVVSTYAIPFGVVGIIAGLLSFIPILGILLSIALWIFSLYLLTVALKATHDLSNARAVLAWLLPGIILTIVFAFLIALFAIATVSAVGPLPPKVTTTAYNAASVAEQLCSTLTAQDQCLRFPQCAWETSSGTCVPAPQ